MGSCERTVARLSKTGDMGEGHCSHKQALEPRRLAVAGVR